MLGAIAGDVAGSTYEIKEIEQRNKGSKLSFEERIRVLDKNIPLFPEFSSITDDSILTCAIADAYLNSKDYVETLRKYGLREMERSKELNQKSRFGRNFRTWLLDSCVNKNDTNGCTMRISPLPNLIDNIDKLNKEVYKATITTHNTKEAILCVNALSDTIYYARNGYSKSDIKRRIESNYFSLNYNLKDLQENYHFTTKALDSVPQSIYVFLTSNDFEDGIRNAISVGGDADTIACMTGAILEAYYGIPEDIKEEVLKYIPDYMISVIEKFYQTKNNKIKVKKYRF